MKLAYLKIGQFSIFSIILEGILNKIQNLRLAAQHHVCVKVQTLSITFIRQSGLLRFPSRHPWPVERLIHDY